MRKIPVRQTFKETVDFIVSHYVSLLGILLLPMLILAVVGYFTVVPLVQQFGVALQQLQHQVVPAGLARLQPLMFAYNAVTALILLMIAVGISKDALALRKGRFFVYFAFGKDELRILAAYFLIFAFLLAALFGTIFVGLIVAIVFAASNSSGSGIQPSPYASISHVAGLVPLIIILVQIVLGYFWVRLSYFIVPATVSEHRFSLWRSWELTKGNFWRITAVILATWIPLIFAELIIGAVIFAPAFPGLSAAAAKGPAAVAAEISLLMTAFVRYLPLVWLGSYVLGPVLYGLIFAPQAFAYRALVLDQRVNTDIDPA